MEALQANIDAIVTNNGVTVAMQTFSGGKVSSTPGTTRDPGARYDRPIPAPATLEPITCSVDYDESKHGATARSWRSLVGTDEQFTVSQIIRDAKGQRIGLDTYTAIITGSTPPEGNTKGGQANAVWTTEFKPKSVGS